MIPLSNDPALFADEALSGFVSAYPDFVVGVPGGVVRARQPRTGKAAVVVGGGSGHYPAFCGLVGDGLADGAVVGNVFTSPSTADVVSVCRAADRGAGVVLLTGNYAGDVMNFTLAVEYLSTTGIDARYIAITDDIASAPPGRERDRRGIAGDLVVFKIAGAAAEEGYDLTDVERVVLKANDRTRTLGVAFDGCTLPGSDHALFSVPPGRVGIGVGIHGEPGVGEESRMPAQELGELLLDRVLADRPIARGARVAVVLNGLGRTKYEELFVLWATVSAHLRNRGVVVVQPDVGELVTSLDMAGCSLTITELDDELESLWVAPAYTPAYRKGRWGPQTGRLDDGSRAVAVDRTDLVDHEARPGSAEAARLARVAAGAMDAALAALVAHEDLLGAIDAVAGDGDHGRGMLRGARAAHRSAQAAAETGVGLGEVLSGAGRAWARAAGGTSGVLWGAMLEGAGSCLPDTPETWDRWAERPVSVLSDAVRSAAHAAQSVGGASVGDKTLLDALLPFADGLARADRLDARQAWRDAAVGAMAAAIDTARLVPKKGRARPLGDRSVGHPDPGAVSLAIIVAALAGDMDVEVEDFVRKVAS